MEIKQEITFEDFQKVDLRVGLVKSAISIEKSNKLIVMQVSFGDFERQIVAGLKEAYHPNTLIEKQLLFVINLSPRKLMGYESHGMVLAAIDKSIEGKSLPTILCPLGSDCEDLPSNCTGSIVS